MMNTLILSVMAATASLASTMASPQLARADDATVDVGSASRFADPPPPPRAMLPTAVSDAPPRVTDEDDDERYVGRELYRSPVRLSLGPAGLTTGRSLGAGIGVAADFGRGSVGFRLAATWLRGEASPGSGTPSPVGDGLAQYTGEVTLDLHKRGPLHPVFGLGFGLAKVNRGDGSGAVGIGTARLGLEYALALEDADARVGLGVTGVLPGPSDRDTQDVRAYALVGAHLSIGF
jgi:hypothetical protein